MAKSIAVAEADISEAETTAEQIGQSGDTVFSGSASMMSGGSIRNKQGNVSHTIVYDLPRSAAKAPIILHEPVVWSNSHSPTGSVVGGSVSSHRGRNTNSSRGQLQTSQLQSRRVSDKSAEEPLSPTQRRLENILLEIESTFARMNKQSGLNYR
jgi:hypothetical protein